MISCPRCKFSFTTTLRTNKQNKYYWAVCVDLISEHTGFTPEEVHEVLKHKFLSPKERMGENIYPNTTQLDTREFNTYIEKIQRWASMELSLVIPDPIVP